jgi:hypothetical protein
MPRLLPGVVLVAIGIALFVGLWLVPLPFPVTRSKTIARVVSFTFATGLLPVLVGAFQILTYRDRQRAIAARASGTPPSSGSRGPVMGIVLVGLVVAVFALGAVQPQRPDAWLEFRDPDGKYMAEFPDTPISSDIGRVWGLVDGSSYMCVSSHLLEGEEWSPDPVERLDRGERVFRQRASGTFAPKDLAIQGVPIRELQGSGSAFSLVGVHQPVLFTRCRIFIVGRRRYTLIGEVPLDRPERQADIQRFFDSFRVLEVK